VGVGVGAETANAFFFFVVLSCVLSSVKCLGGLRLRCVLDKSSEVGMLGDRTDERGKKDERCAFIVKVNGG
jgi:hypothetical protein